MSCLAEGKYGRRTLYTSKSDSQPPRGTRKRHQGTTVPTLESNTGGVALGHMGGRGRSDVPEDDHISRSTLVLIPFCGLEWMSVAP